METFLIILFVVLLICLLVVLGVRPQASSHSKFELRRRANKGDKRAEVLLKRHELLPDIFSLQRVVVAILLVLISAIGIELFHWVIGLVVALVIALESAAVARISLWQRRSQQLYERLEPAILSFIEKHPLIFGAIRGLAPTSTDIYDLESKEELVAIVENSGEVLSKNEKQLILNGLKFEKRQVKEIMTPKSVIDSIDQDEVLGPLVLDDLHKTGHSRFPVTDGDIDHVVGILYIRDLLKIDGSKKKTPKVKQVMDENVCFIREDHDLKQALVAFLKTQKLLFVVINEFRETVGVLSLEDVLEALLGKKINDEFEKHSNLRAVAERNPRQNNQPAQAKDI